MLLFVGLGNPGPKYERNRHNIGFLAVDSIVRRHRFSSWRRKFHGELADGLIAGEKVLALKPLTYMNESGRAVGEAVRFYGFLPDEVVVDTAAMAALGQRPLPPAMVDLVRTRVLLDLPKRYY